MTLFSRGKYVQPHPSSARFPTVKKLPDTVSKNTSLKYEVCKNQNF